MNHSNRRHRVVAYFLAVSYGVGSPITAIWEYREDFFSQRFDLPPEVLYTAFIIQFICAFGVLSRRFAPWSALCLTVITIGAVYAHFRIGSPASSIAAFTYTCLQIWFWYSVRTSD